jgi:hypothetical protein
MSNTKTSVSANTQNKSPSDNTLAQSANPNDDNNNPGRGNNPAQSIMPDPDDDKKKDDPIAKLAATRSMLTEDQKHKLDALDSTIKPKSTNSKFFKFTAGEEKCVLFDPDKIEHVEITYPKKEGEPENKPTKRIKFMIKIAHNDGTVTDDTEEVEWTASETAGKEVIKWMKKGFFLLDIHREGSGKNDTKYDITPHL